MNKLFMLVGTIFFLLLLAAITSLAKESAGSANRLKNLPVDRYPFYPVSDSEPDRESSKMQSVVSLGAMAERSLSPGLTLGTTTYDKQSNSRMNRQVDWRGLQLVHFTWTEEQGADDRWTSYEVYDPTEGSLVFGGCSTHPPTNKSGYTGIDVDTEGTGIIINHYNPFGGLYDGQRVTAFFDYIPAACFFAVYTRSLPDSTMTYGALGTQIFEWPSAEYQVWDGDTTLHVFAREGDLNLNDLGYAPIHYFRYAGSDSAGTWDYPPVIVDTNTCVSQTVTASRVSGKVALVWTAELPQVPGNGESVRRGNQVNNDVYYMISADMGLTWFPKVNVTASDSSQAGWRADGDISCLIATDNNLHIVWNAREFSPVQGGMFPHPFGSRILHWEEASNYISVVKDANWDLPESDYCYGDALDQMSMVKMQISECDDKFYTIFVQFNDIDNGISDDCADASFISKEGGYFIGNPGDGKANGELYISVSGNNGFSWDIARNLTNTRTPGCDTLSVLCESDMWPSMSRFGMQNDPGSDFTSAVVVDPTGSYSGDYFLDVLYVNDLYPGTSFQYSTPRILTDNPVKWFRLPCIEPVSEPNLAVVPRAIGDPAWVKPGIQLDTGVIITNTGHAALNVSITVEEITGSPGGWLDVDNYSFSVPAGYGNTHELGIIINDGGIISAGTQSAEGRIIISSDSPTSPDTIPVQCFIADTLQMPQYVDLRTDNMRLAFSNTGNLGNGGLGGYNMDFTDDCDTTDNISPFDNNQNHIQFNAQSNNARVYLYEGSPFVMRIEGTDTLLNYSMYSADWLNGTGFRPLGSPSVDSTSFPEYQYGHSGEFVTSDSAVSVVCEYFAPIGYTNSEFIVVRQTYTNLTGDSLKDVYVGDIMDFDIPSDYGVMNYGGILPGIKAVYCYGHEVNTDGNSNDCILSDNRCGGFSYYGGIRKPYAIPTDSITEPRGMWTDQNDEYVYPTNGLVTSQFYGRADATIGYEADVDLADQHLAGVTAKLDFAAGEQYEFVKIFIAEQADGITGVQLITYPEAVDWIIDNLPTHIDNIVASSLDDSGPGSLRWAIDIANTQTGPDTINFGVSGTIQLVSSLPAITGDETVILGSAAPGGAYSIILDGSAKTIAGSGLTIQSSNNIVEGLTITGFDDNGVEVIGSVAGNTITNNLIYDNSLLGIDLGGNGVDTNDVGDTDSGPNELLNYPEIDSVFMNPDSSFEVYGHAVDSARVELFVAHPAGNVSRPADPSGHGEAYEYVGTDTCDNAGSFIFTVPNTASFFTQLTATTIDTLGNTSEFCLNFNLIPRPLRVVAYSQSGSKYNCPSLINIRVTDPDQLYIGYDVDGNFGNTIDGPAEYFDAAPVDCNDSVQIEYPKLGQYSIDVFLDPNAPDPLPENPTYTVGVQLNGSLQYFVMEGTADAPAAGETHSYNYDVEEQLYIIGDANGNGAINILDITFLIEYLYLGGPPPEITESGDTNCDGTINILDITVLIAYVYLGGPEPCSPE